MKRVVWGRNLAAALLALAATTVAEAAVTVAYPTPGKSGLMPPNDRQRIVIGNFLDDFFKHAGKENFSVVRDPVKNAILAMVNSGAWTFDTKDKRANFSKWLPVGLFVDFFWVPDPAKPKDDALGRVRVNVWREGADATKDFRMNELPAACGWVMEQILSSCPVSAADAQRLRTFYAARKPFLTAYYLTPGIVGHYTDNGVEPRMTQALAAWKASQFNPLLATRVVDASYLAVLDTRKLKKLTPAKVKALGMDALEKLVGHVEPLDEDILKPFVFHYAKEVRPLLKRVEKKADGGSLDSLEDDVLSGGDDAMELDDELSLKKTLSPKERAAIRASVKRLLDWCDNGYEKPAPDPTISAEVARLTTGGGEHPLAVRHKIDRAFAKGDVAFLEAHLKDVFRQSRAYALRKLTALDPAKAYPHLLEAMEDNHAWCRLQASADLAKLAKKADAGRIRAFLAKEPNRCIRLYLADALAKAEGKPLPPPRPAAHALPKDRSLVWLCGGDGAMTAESPFEAYYTCALPAEEPPETMKKAYAAGKIYFSRPTPCWEGGLIVADPAMADAYWMTMEHQLPDAALACQDGFVFGEESMSMSAEASWGPAWRVFCAEAGIDPGPIAGDIKKLTPEQRVRFNDWGARVAVEGFNELYDFTKTYFGKLKPGILVASYMPQQYGTMGAYAADWKLDVSCGYIYGTGPTRWPRVRNRQAYGIIRKLKTLWPDRPVQWLSCGIPRHPACEKAEDARREAARKARRQYVPTPCYKVIWEQEPFFYRFDESYSATITSWQAGAMAGYFSSFAITGKGGGDACVWLDTEGIYPGYASPSLERGLAYAFEGTLIDYQDALKRKDAPSIGDEDEEEDDAFALEEEGGQDDPAVKLRAADMEKFRTGWLNTLRYIYDTARVQVGMPVYDPRDFKSLLMLTGSGRGTECSASQWMDGFDCVDNALQPVRLGTLSRYRFIAVTDANGKGTAMDEATRQAYLKWLKETPGVLWVEGWLGENPRRTFEKPQGDLVTKWPWPSSVTNGTASVTVWRDPAYKAIVIFEKPQKKATEEPILEGGRIVKEFFAANKVDFAFPKAYGMISTKVGNLEVHALSQRSTYKGTVEGVELLTGETNPALTVEDDDAFATVVKGDWMKPYVAVHDGVRVIAGNRFEKAEPVSGGVKVTSGKGPFGAPSALPAKDVKCATSGATATFTR